MSVNNPCVACYDTEVHIKSRGLCVNCYARVLRIEDTPESYAAACEQIEDAIERERDERDDARWDW